MAESFTCDTQMGRTCTEAQPPAKPPIARSENKLINLFAFIVKTPETIPPPLRPVSIIGRHAEAFQELRKFQAVGGVAIFPLHTAVRGNFT